MKTELSSIQRQALKAQAHDLSPVVMIGNNGLTPAVVREIDINLKAHELIKVKANSDVREERVGWLAEVCEKLSCTPIAHVGKQFILWRLNPDKKEPAPIIRARPVKLNKKQSAAKLAGGTEPAPAIRKSRVLPLGILATEPKRAKLRPPGDEAKDDTTAAPKNRRRIAYGPSGHPAPARGKFVGPPRGKAAGGKSKPYAAKAAPKQKRKG